MKLEPADGGAETTETEPETPKKKKKKRGRGKSSARFSGVLDSVKIHGHYKHPQASFSGKSFVSAFAS